MFKLTALFAFFAIAAAVAMPVAADNNEPNTDWGSRGGQTWKRSDEPNENWGSRGGQTWKK
jgi:hypothetical protein